MTTANLPAPAFGSRDLPPPHNTEAEQALLGAILVNNEAWHKIADRLKPEQFADALHARIYEACGKLIARGMKADPVTLKRLFDQDLALADAGGAHYLVRLAQAVVSIRHVDDFATIIADTARRRRLIDVAAFIYAEAHLEDPDCGSEKILEMVEAKLTEISLADQMRVTMRTIGEAADAALQAVERAMKQGFGGLSTGIRALDKKLGGLHASDLIILAGRPSMGKTALASNIADNRARAAREARAIDPRSPEAGAVVFFSCEMSAEQLAQRHMAWRANVSTFSQRDGYVKPDEWTRLHDARGDLMPLPLYVDDQPAVSPAQIRSRARKIQRREGVSLIIVDYLQLMSTSSRNYIGNRVQEMSEISREMKGIAKELEVPVIALSQLSRKVEDRDDKRPQLNDLRESGSIEQDADTVMFVYREEYYLGRAEPKRHANETDARFSERYANWQSALEAARNIADGIVAKNRQGPIGTARMYFNGELTAFGDLSEQTGD